MFNPPNVTTTPETDQWTRYSQRPSHGLENSATTPAYPSFQRGDYADSPSYQHASMRMLQDQCRIEASPKPSPSGRPSYRFSAAISRDGLRRCQLTLQRALHKCTDVDCQDFACIISCLLSTFRRLRVSEVQSAVAMHAFAQRSERLWIDRTTSEFRAWLIKFGILFVVDNDDCVSFGVPEMPHFLSNFRIRGIDASHRTIAMISLAFIELTHSDTPPDLPLEFLSYSGANWQQHCEIAARTSISLRYDRLIRQRSKLVKQKSLDRRRQRADTPPLNMVQRQFELMDIGGDGEEQAEEEDWVLI